MPTTKLSHSQTKAQRLIGVLASKDSVRKNNSVARVLEEMYRSNPALLEKFHFVFSGGTFKRVMLGQAQSEGIMPVGQPARRVIMRNSTCLPSFQDGGVTILSYLIVQRMCRIVIPFLDQITTHWLNPENLALMRLSDTWQAKRLMNTGSVMRWFESEAEMDCVRDRKECPLSLVLASSGKRAQRKTHQPVGYSEISTSLARPEKWPSSIEDMTIALIAHDEMKSRMVEFAIEFEDILCRFKRILTTGNTGREVAAATTKLEERIFRYRSGPKGGDIEIATEVLYGQCHLVVFFIDPLHPHPHIEDIRTVFSACMIQDRVQMLTNEQHARKWMDQVC